MLVASSEEEPFALANADQTPKKKTRNRNIFLLLKSRFKKGMNFGEQILKSSRQEARSCWRWEESTSSPLRFSGVQDCTLPHSCGDEILIEPISNAVTPREAKTLCRPSDQCQVYIEVSNIWMVCVEVWAVGGSWMAVVVLVFSVAALSGNEGC